MLSKIAIDFTVLPHHNSRVLTHHTDDPVEAEEFIMHLLAAGAHIKEVRHDGAKLSGHQFDKMLRVAAERIATLMLCTSLGIDAAEAKHRFGLAA